MTGKENVPRTARDFVVILSVYFVGKMAFGSIGAFSARIRAQGIEN